jgi:hypothetical protein
MSAPTKIKQDRQPPSQAVLLASCRMSGGHLYRTRPFDSRSLCVWLTASNGRRRAMPAVKLEQVTCGECRVAFGKLVSP